MIVNADLVLGTIPEPQPSIARSRELLNAAKKLAADLVTHSVPTNAAAALGSKGGSKTAAEWVRTSIAEREKIASDHRRISKAIERLFQAIDTELAEAVKI